MKLLELPYFLIQKVNYIFLSLVLVISKDYINLYENIEY